MSLIDQIEKSEEIKFLQAIQHQQQMYGKNIRVFEKTKTVYDSVYGSASGEIPKSFFDISGLLVSDDFFVQDSRRKGSFEEGFLYTTCTEKLLPGQLIEVSPEDGRTEQYRIVLVEGTQYTRVAKYRLAATDSR